MSELNYSGTIDVEVSCHECGALLVSSVHGNSRTEWLEVEPCTTCTDKAYADGERDGLAAAKEQP